MRTEPWDRGIGSGIGRRSRWMRPVMPRGEDLMDIVVVVQSQSELFQIVFAGGTPGSFPGLLHTLAHPLLPALKGIWGQTSL